MSGNDGFKGHLGPKSHSPSIIHDHEDRSLPFFAKYLEVGFMGSRHHSPIHEAHIIARLIPARFLKIHASAFKRGALATCQEGMHPFLGFNPQYASLVAHIDEIGKLNLHPLKFWRTVQTEFG
jgi:hypothetical protein